MLKARTAAPLLFWLLLLCALFACTLPVARPRDPKTPSEQWLISHAIENSVENMSLDLPRDTTIVLDTSGLTTDQTYMADVIAGRLSKQELVLRKDDKEADYRVQLIIQSLGVRRNVKIVGIAGGQANTGLIGIGIPELALWKKDQQRGISRFYMNIYEAGTNRLLRATPWYRGASRQTSYTLFFVFHWTNYELFEPPEGWDEDETPSLD